MRADTHFRSAALAVLLLAVVALGGCGTDRLDPSGASASDGSTSPAVAGKWPLYSYTGDTAPGDVIGQGSGEVWYVVAPDGTLIMDDPLGEDL